LRKSLIGGAPPAPAQAPAVVWWPYGGEPPAAKAIVPAASENNPVDLARIGWLATVLVCLVTVLILLLQGYYGYAGVTFAVAVSAAINLL
jgi:hypothetical protein